MTTMMNLRQANIYVTETQKPNQNESELQSYKVHFNGTEISTVVTSKSSVIKDWIKFIQWLWKYPTAQRLIVGLGVQWHPNWKNKKNNIGVNNSAADTLQLCIGNHCLIIQLAQAYSVPDILRRFLKDPKYTFVGIQNSTDVLKLKKSVHELIVDSKVFNLASYADQQPASITSMAVQFLGLGGVRNDPKIGMSNWNARRLNVDQVQYACVDAHVSFLLAKSIGFEVFL